MGSPLLILFVGKHIYLLAVTNTKQALTISLIYGSQPEALKL